MFPVFSEGAGGQSRAQREAAAAPETIKTAASQLRRGWQRREEEAKAERKETWLGRYPYRECAEIDLWHVKIERVEGSWK